MGIGDSGYTQSTKSVLLRPKSHGDVTFLSSSSRIQNLWTTDN